MMSIEKEVRPVEQRPNNEGTGRSIGVRRIADRPHDIVIYLIGPISQLQANLRLWIDQLYCTARQGQLAYSEIFC
jgi:hypothetical protein